MILSKNSWRLWAIPVCMAALAGCGKSGGSSGTESSSTGAATPAKQTINIHKAADPNSLKMAFITNNASEFWKMAAAGINKYDKENNCQVDIKNPPSGKVAEQNSIIDTLVAQNYNSIACSTIAPADQINVLNRAARTSNVLCFDSDCAQSNRIMYIGTNNFAAGEVLGKEIVKLLPKGGNIAFFVGTFSADNAAQRLNGVLAAIKGHHIKVIAKKEDKLDRAKARSNVEDVMNAYPNLNLVVGLWSYNGPAIAAAISASGKTGKIKAAVFDEEPGTLDAIKSGVLNCTVVQDPFMEGYLTAKWMHDIAVQGSSIKLPKGHIIDTGVTLITKANVEDHEKKVAKEMAGS